MPYMEQGSLYAQFNLSQPVQDSPAIGTLVKTFICPSDLNTMAAFTVTGSSWNAICIMAPSSYAACCGGGVSTTAATGNGCFYRNSAVRFTDIIDGTEQHHLH